MACTKATGLHRILCPSELLFCDYSANVIVGCWGCEIYSLLTGIKICFAPHCRAGRVSQMGKYAGLPPMKALGEIRCFPVRMQQAENLPDLRSEPRYTKSWLSFGKTVIFLNSLGESFDPHVPLEFWLKKIIPRITSEKGCCHIYMVTTRRPDQALKLCRKLQSLGLPWPENLWIGTSVTSQETVDARLPYLRQIGDQTTTRFVFASPQMYPLRLGKHLKDIQWVLNGGDYSMQPWPYCFEDGLSLLQECRDNGASFFMIQGGKRPSFAGKPLHLHSPFGDDPYEWPVALPREMPAIYAASQGPVFNPDKGKRHVAKNEWVGAS